MAHTHLCTMKLGIIGKNNNKGLGILTRQYMKHLDIKKYAEISYVPDNFFDDLDVVIILEWYSKQIIDTAHEKGCKVVLKVNYEFLPEKHEGADLYLCSSSLNYEVVNGNKILIPDPVEVGEVRERTICKTFVHNAGTLGIGGANGTKELIEALKYAVEPFKMIIRAQVPIECKDERVDLRIGDFPHEELFTEGDVFVMPQKFRATSLPIQEAMASGMPVLSSNIKPFNEFVNFTFDVDGFKPDMILRVVQNAKLNPRKIAKELDALYNRDITNESKDAIFYGKSITWENLKEEYRKILCDI